MSNKEVHFDFNFMMQEHIGDESGINPDDIESLQGEVTEIHEELTEKRKKKEIAFFDLPYEGTSTIRHMADDIAGKYDTFLLLGIGGSSLGPVSIHNAFHSPFYNQLESERNGRPRMYFLDNVDPDETASFLKVLDMEKTAVAVITKSGSTAETMSGFLIFLEAIKKAAVKFDPS